MATVLAGKNKKGEDVWQVFYLFGRRIYQKNFYLKSEAEEWAEENSAINVTRMPRLKAPAQKPKKSSRLEEAFKEPKVFREPAISEVPKVSIVTSVEKSSSLEAKTEVPIVRTLGHIFNRYLREVSPKKKGFKWEGVRICMLIRSSLADRPLADLGPEHLAEWRDLRLKTVLGTTVRREMGMIASILETARREWRWIQVNPARDVRKPPEARHRTQRILPEDQEKLIAALNYIPGTVPTTSSHETAIALLFALQTAMRSGEILAIRKKDIHMEDSYVHVPESKNGSPRNVALTEVAKNLLRVLMKGDRRSGDRVFSINSGSRQNQFRDAKIKTGLMHIHFHDSRREAITWLAKVLSPLELARMTGHKRLDELLTYYEPSASELAEKLRKATKGKD